jgi:hypothetical protein
VNLLIQTLDACGVRYAISGSLASSVYSEIRYTYDIDLTIQMTVDQVAPFIENVQELGWYISPEGVAKAVTQGGDFQVIDGMVGVKADCYVTAPHITPRQQRTLARARIKTYNAQGHQAVFFSPEDVILYKLEWYMLGKSEKHLRDIGAILITQGD